MMKHQQLCVRKLTSEPCIYTWDQLQSYAGRPLFHSHPPPTHFTSLSTVCVCVSRAEHRATVTQCSCPPCSTPPMRLVASSERTTT